ncbi:MAG: 2OG-Fe(II) oxygenase [Alphaproteobacteria bacterium]|nr:2OG-Fe(II) oxygenase [Alphaproteobacteria bacterium]MBV9373285.1 2OG-Fe(II) oxygenase [Alphaproteobacteria bacterium]MBV9901248.1 2OG-Fe(II) oxygenase [Alphaproteobacteria bacterium]
MHGDVTSQVEALLGARRFADAARHLTAAAARGDRAALSLLAEWRISGTIVRRDLAAARGLFGRAASAGDTDSALLHAAFLATGTGGEEDWRGAVAALERQAPRSADARAQLRLIGAMDLDEGGAPRSALPTRPLSEAPHVVVAEGFATAAECDYLVAKAEGALQPSTVVDPGTGRLIPHPIRSSEGAMYGVYDEDVAVNALNRRIAALSGTVIAQGEPLQLLRYRPGGEYRAHMDALPAEPNQRILTVLVYLSDDYEGGETRFPRTGLSFRGRRGDALLFRNVGPYGEPEPLSIHAGLPVTRGVKTIASRWIRAGRFTYPPPRPLLDL